MPFPDQLRSLGPNADTVVGPAAQENVLNLDVTDRRRVVVAAALTIVALPAIWLFARGEPSAGTAAPNVAGAAGLATPGAGAVTTPATDQDAFGTNSPIFVDGPTTPPKPAIVPVIIPSENPGQSLNGSATYRRNADPLATTCSSAVAPFDAKLTVTNTNNGFSVQCVNRTPKVLTAGLSIELTTAQFQQIAELVDSPVPVRISWGTG